MLRNVKNEHSNVRCHATVNDTTANNTTAEQSSDTVVGRVSYVGSGLDMQAELREMRERTSLFQEVQELQVAKWAGEARQTVMQTRRVGLLADLQEMQNGQADMQMDLQDLKVLIADGQVDLRDLCMRKAEKRERQAALLARPVSLPAEAARDAELSRASLLQEELQDLYTKQADKQIELQDLQELQADGVVELQDLQELQADKQVELQDLQKRQADGQVDLQDLCTRLAELRERRAELRELLNTRQAAGEVRLAAASLRLAVLLASEQAI